MLYVIACTRKDAYQYLVGQRDPHLASTKGCLIDALEYVILRGDSILASRNRQQDLEEFYAELNGETEQPTSVAQPSVPAIESCAPECSRAPPSTLDSTAGQPSPSTPAPTSRANVRVKSPNTKSKLTITPPVVVVTDSEDDREHRRPPQSGYVSLAPGVSLFLTL